MYLSDTEYVFKFFPIGLKPDMVNLSRNNRQESETLIRIVAITVIIFVTMIFAGCGIPGLPGPFGIPGI